MATLAPLIVITGPTASGKSDLALDLAERYNGEIICADSRTIYKGMDIGTAKPTDEDRERVPHHLLDIAEPGERYTVADFQKAANMTILEIRKRGNVPFVVGGTGLYIDAVTLDFEWPEITANDELESEPIETLQLMIKKQHLVTPVNNKNKRHLIATLRRGIQQPKSRAYPRKSTTVVSIATAKPILDERIKKRAEKMFAKPILEEARGLAEHFGWDSEAMKGNIYPLMKRVAHGEITLEHAKELFITKDIQLAKRQVTWIRRHDYVKWLIFEDAKRYLETILE
jgi:tRNA dimethylallyltransferase